MSQRDEKSKMTLTVCELIEILELFDSDQPVYISQDRIKYVPVHEAGSVRRARKIGDKNQNIEEASFVFIN